MNQEERQKHVKEVGPGRLKTRPAVEFVATVDGGACPPSLEWFLAPDRGAEGCLTRSVVVRMAFGRLRRPRVQELKSSPALQARGRQSGLSPDWPPTWDDDLGTLRGLATAHL